MQQLKSKEPLPSSYRDHAGYVFRDGDVVKRAVTCHGKDDYDLYVQSGLHGKLTAQNLVVDYYEETLPRSERERLHAILVPQQIPFVSYPYEWSFDQLKDAALLTLQIQEMALAHGMSLKDASAYNVQFIGSTPVFIDLSSFEADRGGPWIAYEQFCRHFLGPLLLMQYVDGGFNRYLRANLEGFDLRLVSRMLPWRTWLRPDLIINTHLHARYQGRSGAGVGQGAKPGTGLKRPGTALKKNVLESLRRAVEGTRAPASSSLWSVYETHRHHYSLTALNFKFAEVRKTLQVFDPGMVYDLGANNGQYSTEAARLGSYCVSLDAEPSCVNENYQRGRRSRNRRLHPLLMDLSNPSPGGGFDFSERSGLQDRPVADLALALALVHHLRVAGRVPYRQIARFFARLARNVLIEFVPASDSEVKEFMGGRTDPFDDYTLEGFLDAFDGYFELTHRANIPDTTRSLWLARRRPGMAPEAL